MRKPSTDITQTLSANIKRLRSEKRLSQEELADKCGLHRTYIGAVERGERNVTLSSLELIASALEVNVPTLLSNN
ncbi:MAG: helix-turn-helix domain-containing protein [bacterium]